MFALAASLAAPAAQPSQPTGLTAQQQEKALVMEPAASPADASPLWAKVREPRNR